MRFGMLHLFESPEIRTERELIHEQFEIMQAAEDLGFDSVWPAEHHFTEYGYCTSTALVLAALARTTKRIRFGTGVVVLPFHNPIRVAEEFAFLDNLSDGRLDFGVGRGYQPIEYQGFGVDQTKSREMFLEEMEIIRQAWTQDRVTFEGKYHTVDATIRPKPLQQPHPPIWIAAVSKDSFDMVGSMGANLLYSPAFTPEKIEPVKKRLASYKQALSDNGHDPATKSIGAMRMVYVADSAEQARRDFEQPVLWFYRVIGGYIAPKEGEVAGYGAYAKLRELTKVVDYDALVENGSVIAGTPEYCARRIEEMQEEFGFTDLLAWTRMGGLDHRKVMRSMELMEREVIPHFKEKGLREKVAAATGS